MLGLWDNGKRALRLRIVPLEDTAVCIFVIRYALWVMRYSYFPCERSHKFNLTC